MPNKTGVQFTVTAERIHWDTDITLFHDFLNKEECQHLIDLAEPKLKRSGTFTGPNDPRRTSSSVFLTAFRNDPIVKETIYRASVLSGYPLSHVEIPQIVRYKPGEKFVSHSDNYPLDSPNYKQSGQRDYTFFLYLNEPTPDDTENPQTGGETFFTQLDLKIEPKQGTAVFWRNVNIVTGDDEKYAKICHSGEPTENWTKYGMNIWIRHKYWGTYTY